MTPAEMREGVARAIYEGRNGRGCRAWNTLLREHRVCYLGDADAALAFVREALREPTAEMIDAVRDAKKRGMLAEGIYRAMLAASPLRDTSERDGG